MKARPVSLDAKQRVIYMVGYMVKEQCYAGAAIIVRDTETVFYKATGPGRPYMAEWLLKLQLFERVRKFRGPLHTGAKCLLCLGARAHGAGIEAVMQEGIFRCGSCTLAWQVKCARLLEQECQAIEFGCPYCLGLAMA